MHEYLDATEHPETGHSVRNTVIGRRLVCILQASAVQVSPGRLQNIYSGSHKQFYSAIDCVSSRMSKHHSDSPCTEETEVEVLPPAVSVCTDRDEAVLRRCFLFSRHSFHFAKASRCRNENNHPHINESSESRESVEGPEVHTQNNQVPQRR